ncbi:MAG TPA: tRNA (N(6)-L-threonylcarbamoyladenosine(37)-C(2))-methylthiotransferase MtaB [Candidatus Acidoferrales bacterium]|nr:tRNA (N(6)-L-threonylcarbamoyladenosine(37)-C(2))-methylthiotransferase MtaB [Candidatus Acidoferrales bacterium]
MATFFIQNFGCRATQSDATAIRQSLLSRGYAAAHSDGAADVIVLNTCTVTAAADAEARETVRRMHRANPRARIVVTGCYSQRAPEELSALEGVSLVVGNSFQVEIAELLGAARDFVPLSRLEPRPHAAAPVHRSEISEVKSLFVAPPAEAMRDLTRPILKIQDGCNHRCSYCVIPSVRGRSRSLPPDQVISAVQQMVGVGAREIVLSGIDLGSYGRAFSPRVTLPELIRRILDETQLERLRISSVEPMDITSDFIGLVASSDRIAPHFHMPLQSGSDRILRDMHRWYRSAHYARRVELIRERLPHAAIGADVIAGFPGETEEDHRLTMQFLESLPLSYLHVFSFSPRPGTEAASLPGAAAVPQQIIQCRARELRAIGAGKAKAFRASQTGRVLRVLTLGRAKDEWTEALSGNYLKVRILGRWPRNRWFDATLNDSEAPIPAAPLVS